MKRFGLLLIGFIVCLATYGQNEPYRSDVNWVTTPSNTSWLYALSEEAYITVSLFEYGQLQDNLEISYSVGPELMPADTKGLVRLDKGKATIALGTMAQPGFRDCRLSVVLNGNTYTHHIKVGFEPEKLLPYTTFPDDFEGFWDEGKAKATRCPLYFERVFVPEYSSALVDCYLVKLQVYEKGQFVYGYLTMPKEVGKYPVVFSPPGAGIKPMDPLKDIFYAENGFIRFDMEIHGIRPDLDRATYDEVSRSFGQGNNSYLVNGLGDRDAYYMKKVYLSFGRVVDYLTSLPEWDGQNVIAQGNSQGGALALVAAALDSRVTACAAAHPALSDMAGYKAGRAGGYPHFFTKFEGMDTPEKINTMAYYDVVNFARLIKVPVFMTWGFNDNVCPPTTSYIVYNVLGGQKEALITPVNEHWISTTTRHSIMEWIKKQLK
jgi:cephalosporin-C deacetylase-like acetyl esterase